VRRARRVGCDTNDAGAGRSLQALEGVRLRAPTSHMQEKTLEAKFTVWHITENMLANKFWNKRNKQSATRPTE